MTLLLKRKPDGNFRINPLLSLPALALLLCLLAVSCQTRVPEQQIQEINVAAAANLTEAFAELGREFNRRTGVRVVYSYGATADLARQIEQDAPFDVFASADVSNVKRLEDKGLLAPEGMRLYARGRLIIWTPPGARFQIRHIEDLARAEVERVGIARPEVAPYGQAAIEALRALNLWPQLESKAVYGQNVSQVRQYAATGNVDAAFLPLALVRAGEGQTLEVDEKLHRPINQAITVLKKSAKQEAARRFVEYVLSDEGQALLERYGYRKP